MTLLYYVMYQYFVWWTVSEKTRKVTFPFVEVILPILIKVKCAWQHLVYIWHQTYMKHIQQLCCCTMVWITYHQWCILLIHLVQRTSKNSLYQNPEKQIQYNTGTMTVVLGLLRTWWVCSSLPSLIHCFVFSTLSGTVKMCFRFSMAVTYCECLMFSSRTSCSLAYSAGTAQNDSSIHFRLEIHSTKHTTWTSQSTKWKLLDAMLLNLR
jgi:hypothetical protein